MELATTGAARPPLILAFEIAWKGIAHASVNRSLLRVVTRACPHARVIFHADRSHLDEAMAIEPEYLSQVETRAITLTTVFANRPHIASFRRLLRETEIFADAMRPFRGERCLVLLGSSTCTAITAARMAMARHLAPDSHLQVILHGELNAIDGWQPRNPVDRFLGLRSALHRADSARTRFLVLEHSILAALLGRYPTIEPAFDVLPHPVPILPQPATAVESRLPLHVGLVGQATREKGIGTFLEVARRAKAALGDQVQFHHIGRMPPDVGEAELAVLDSPSSPQLIPTAEFNARIQALHYVFLPLEPSYYTLSASGAVLDALVRGKPIITSDIALTQSYFANYGDIGYLYAEPDQAAEAMRHALRSIRDGSYHTKVRAVSAAAASRGIGASAAVYRAILSRHAPWMLAPENPIGHDA